MNILLTGGGSGGHIKPVLAVARELKRQQPEVVITYVGQKGDDLLDVVQQEQAIDIVETIWAGKLRRYSGEGWQQLLDVKTQLLNLRDVVRTLAGIWQSYWLLGTTQPEIVFTRGGFVSVPVALAARLRGIPYITHDADSIPSLANRLIARGATKHAVALPIELYPYPASKTVQVGIPAGEEYVPVTERMRTVYRHDIGLEAFKHVLLVTGGGNGARALNEIVVANIRYLLAAYPDLAIIHFAGRSLVQETNDAYDALKLGKARRRIIVEGFTADFYRYSGAADVVVARGGMSSLTEFALQHKACIIVPSRQLAWNVKNSRALAKRSAIIELSEDQAEQPERLGRLVGELLDDPERRQKLGDTLSRLAHPAAARDIAEMIFSIRKGVK
ncbi:glycosyltransferase [Candidatus Saccharibacteria bacterium]|nr:glycosyltransferase [Candidatus Saccharibacteria bacterium]